jgi:hypothetical protein
MSTIRKALKEHKYFIAFLKVEQKEYDKNRALQTALAEQAKHAEVFEQNDMTSYIYTK